MSADQIRQALERAATGVHPADPGAAAGPGGPSDEPGLDAVQVAQASWAQGRRIRRRRRVASAVAGAAAVAAVGVAVLTAPGIFSDDRAAVPASESSSTVSPSPAPLTSAPSPSPSPSPSSASPSPSPSDSTATAPPTLDLSGFGLEQVTAGGFPTYGPSVGVGTDVRVGSHDGYDRVVFEFSGDGPPAYRVGYEVDPRSDGAGEPISIPEGSVALAIRLSFVDYPTSGSAPALDDSLTGTVLTTVDPIWGGFEGYGESFLGVAGGARPFRVSVLSDPTRLVIDIASGTDPVPVTSVDTASR